jgi:hypothetical protein
VRAIVTGLVAVGLLGSSGEAAAGTEWVVLRVERVEVAVARADGSPWDDSTPTASQAAPDLGVRLTIDATSYASAVAPDRLVHDFAYDFLVPLEAVPPAGLGLEIFDQDGNDPRRGEELGTIRVTRSDITDLLAGSSRVKTFSHDSVTRLEVTSRRYTKSSRRLTATVRPGKREVRLAPSIVAGELIEARASSDVAIPTIVVGPAQDRIAIGRCARALITSSGAVTATLDGSSTNGRFGLRVLRPSLAMWTRGGGWVPCDGRRVERRSLAAISQVQALSGSTLRPDAIRKIVQSRYLAGVQRCHERLLRSDPMATGRLRVRYSVGPTGGVVKVSAKGLERALETCVESLMVKWRFAAPKDAHGTPTTEDVEAELLLDAR